MLLLFYLCERVDLPSGLTPCTLWSQPHFSSSPLLQALVTANATLAAEMAYTKAASRVPNTHRERRAWRLAEWNSDR